MTFFFVIAVFSVPAGVRKNPIGLHLRCLVAYFFVIRVFLLPAGVRKNPSGLHFMCYGFAVAISITVVR